MSQWASGARGAINQCIVLFFSSIDRAKSVATARAWCAALACIAASSACSPSAFIADRDTGAEDAAARDSSVNLVDAAFFDAGRVAPTLSCDAQGSGEISVQLQLAPSVDDSDLWLAVLCGRTIDASARDERPVRLVRVPRGERAVTLRELGDGYYRVIASANETIAGSSDAVQLRGATSAVTLVAVDATSVPAWSVSGTIGGASDSGVAPQRDASAGDGGGSDASASPATTEFDVTASGVGAARVGLLVSPRETGWQDVSFALANPCSGSTCPVFRVSALELRVERDGLPAALVTMTLGMNRGIAVAPSELFTTEARIVPAAVFAPGARLKLTLFGAAGL